MPVAKLTLAQDYRMNLAQWEGTKPSELFWWTPNLASDTEVTSVRCYVRCKTLWYPLFLLFGTREFKPCEYTRLGVAFLLNGITALDKDAHVTSDLFGEGKAHMSRERNSAQVLFYKKGGGDITPYGGVFDVWVEIEYSGTAPDPDIQSATVPTAQQASASLSNPTFPWADSAMLGQLSPLLIIVVAVLVLVLIISAIRRS